MAKIVIIAPAGAEDVADAVKLLKAAGHDVDTEEPTPKSLLHIVLGLLGPNAYGFGPGYAYAPGAQADDDAALDVSTELDVADEGGEEVADEEPVEYDAGADDFNFEGTTVDGEPIEAVSADLEHSVLVVEKMVVGPKTTYMLNESTFSFWPASQEQPAQRVDVAHDGARISIELVVEQGVKQELRVGKDLLKMFEMAGGVEEKIKKHNAAIKEVGQYGKHADLLKKAPAGYQLDKNGKITKKLNDKDEATD